MGQDYQDLTGYAGYVDKKSWKILIYPANPVELGSVNKGNYYFRFSVSGTNKFHTYFAFSAFFRG